LPWRRWADDLGVEHTEDPRSYKGSEIIGVKPAEEVPRPIPEANKYIQGKKRTRLDYEAHVLDIAFFYKRPNALVNFVKAYNPTTLIISWYFTRESYTANLLARSGLISRIIAENEKYLITGVKDRSIIKLGDGQSSAIDKLSVEFKNPEKWKKGSTNWITGKAGTGKTLIGIEFGRMIGAWRRDQEKEKKVEIIFCGEKIRAKLLVDKMKETGMLGIIRGVEFTFLSEMYEKRLQLGEWSLPNLAKQLQEIIDHLSKQVDQHYVLIIDELFLGPYYVFRVYCRERVDLILIQNPRFFRKKRNIASDQDGYVRIHTLSVAYRQEKHPRDMATFVAAHDRDLSELDMKKCLVGHSLKYTRNGENWLCDGCGGGPYPGINNFSKRFKCQQCDYDLCENAALPMKKRSVWALRIP